MRYFLVVGEASADLHASRLIQALKEQDREARFAYMGGDLMAQVVGEEPIAHYRDVAFMGIIPVLRNLSTIRKVAKQVQKAMLDFRPDVVIPVDFAGFNFEYILPFVKKHLSCPIYYYIAPKLWAWKPWRIKTLRRYVDLLLCILPFETEYFGQKGLKAVYVGNPCVDATLDTCGLSIQPKQQIAILAGSRRQELASNLAVMLKSTEEYSPRYSIVVAGAPGLGEEDYASYLEAYPHVQLRFDSTYTIVRESMVALVTSGTATLETALLGTPEVVLYRMGGQRLARWVFDHLFSVPYISLVNLILGREAVPELIGAEVNCRNITRHLKQLLTDSQERKEQLQAITELRKTLGQERTSILAAQEIIKQIRNR